MPIILVEYYRKIYATLPESAPMGTHRVATTSPKLTLTRSACRAPRCVYERCHVRHGGADDYAKFRRGSLGGSSLCDAPVDDLPAVVRSRALPRWDPRSPSSVGPVHRRGTPKRRPVAASSRGSETAWDCTCPAARVALGTPTWREDTLRSVGNSSRLRTSCTRVAARRATRRDPMTLRVLAGWRERLEAELGRPLHQDDYSTEHQARVGPRECSRLTDHHNAMVRAALLRHRGHEVKTTGDGFLATFDATGRALRCPAEIVRGAKDIWLELRAGVHTGEVEVRGDDIAGLAVTIAKRICDLSGPGQVLVSETARGHMVGNGSIQFRV